MSKEIIRDLAPSSNVNGPKGAEVRADAGKSSIKWRRATSAMANSIMLSWPLARELVHS